MKCLPLHFLAVIFSVACYWSAPSSATAAPPNIVVIMVDDMGYGDLGCYNPDSKIPTPNIDQLAREGMMFSDAHAPGALCHVSRYGLMTGRFPFRTNPSVWRKQPLIDADQVTVPSFLKSNGYRTAMIGKWHLGFKENGYENRLPGGPVDRGFESYFGIRASTDIPPYFYIRNDRAVAPPTNRIEANQSEGWSPIQGAFWRAGGIAPNLELKDVLPRFTEEAVKLIREHGSRDKKDPLMLYLAYPAPHTPWLPSDEFVGKSKAGMYGDFTVMVDAMIGRVLTALSDSGMKENTVVMMSSDNGPVWYDADVKRFGHDSVGGLRGMKADAWEGGHRMPFIVRWPNVVKAGSQSDHVICFTDLLATCADILGVDLPEKAGPDSFSFLKVLNGTQPDDKPVRGPLVIPAGGGIKSIRLGQWKLITGLGSGGFSKPSRVKPKLEGPTGQLYNMLNDRNETRNLFAEKPEIVRHLSAVLARVEKTEMSRELPLSDIR